LLNSSDELGDYVIRQLRELGPNLRPADHVLDLGQRVLSGRFKQLIQR
jgi:hypothetical protein